MITIESVQKAAKQSFDFNKLSEEYAGYDLVDKLLYTNFIKIYELMASGNISRADAVVMKKHMLDDYYKVKQELENSKLISTKTRETEISRSLLNKEIAAENYKSALKIALKLIDEYDGSGYYRDILE